MDRGRFNWVLAFASPTLSAHVVVGALINWVRAVFVHKGDLWGSLVEAFHLETVLSHTPVILIYRDGNQVHSRCLARSRLPYLPWGLEELRRCNTCTYSLPMDVEYRWRSRVLKIDGRSFTDTQAQLRQYCRRCKCDSLWVSRPEWVHFIPHCQPCYWFDWPVNSDRVGELRGAFVQRAL